MRTGTKQGNTVSPDKRVAVIGVGNILMGDEGLGVHAIEALRGRVGEFGRSVELVDAGTALLDVIDDYTDCDVLIVIDVVRGGGEPGAIYRFDLEDFRAADHSGTPTSLHELSVLEVLDMERLTGRVIPHVIVVGMEPERIAAHLDMSAAVAEKLPRLVETVLDELKSILSTDRKAETQE